MGNDRDENFNIDIGFINNNLDDMITPDVKEYVSSQVGRENLGKLTREWWIDFFIGVNLWGVAAGVIRVAS